MKDFDRFRAKLTPALVADIHNKVIAEVEQGVVLQGFGGDESGQLSEMHYRFNSFAAKFQLELLQHYHAWLHSSDE